MLPDYAHHCSPRKYTQPQFFACLVLKAFFGTDYRSIEADLRDLPEFGRMLGLKDVPDQTTS